MDKKSKRKKLRAEEASVQRIFGQGMDNIPTVVDTDSPLTIFVPANPNFMEPNQKTDEDVEKDSGNNG